MNNDIEWRMVKLGDVATIIRGGSPRPIEDYITTAPDGVNWVKIGDVAVGAKYIEHTEEKIIPEGLHKSRSVKAGDFLLSNSMSFGRPYILKIDGAIHDGWLAIQNYEKTFEIEYLYYALLTEFVMNQYKSMAAGSSVLNLNKQIVAKVLIPVPYKNNLPDLVEQRKIAEKMGDMDSLIASKEKLLAKKRNLKTAAMQKLIKDEESENWRKVKLGDCGHFSKGAGISRSESNSGSIPAVRYGELYTKHNDYIKEFFSFISRNVANTSRKLTKGDVLFTASGETKEDIGKSVAFLNDFEAYAGGDIIILSPYDNFDSKFLGFLLNSEYIRKQKAEVGQGDAVVHIRTTAIKNLFVYIPFTTDGQPDLTEQKRIATILSDMDSEISSIENEITKLRNLKTAMMQKMFQFEEVVE